MRVGIVGQRGSHRAVYLVEELRARLHERDVETSVDEVTAAAIDVPGVPVERMSECDLVVSIGGDGTFLFAARGAGTTPIMGVNLGEVGFLNAVDPDNAVPEVLATVEAIREGEAETRDALRLRAAGEGWSLGPALNEIVVQGPRRGPGGGAEIEVRVDGSLYAGGNADGVLIATPTGSTAYNLSEGGPLIYPSVDGLVVTEMCAAEAMRPLVVDADAAVEVRIDDAPTGYAISDGRTRREIDPPTAVEVRTTDEPLHLAGPNVDFFEALGKLE